ncbi:MAG: hypothetical protein NPINA01_23320 [Nitrospinaceae bacterium]|nr:MAG: hypothetical protein NPINA01_23320 [Nitrospinaceae bacterium]
MKAKNKSKAEFFKSTPLRRKPRASKSTLSQKPELLPSFGEDAKTIRQEVMRVKNKLKNDSRLFEQLGSQDLLKKRKG